MSFDDFKRAAGAEPPDGIHRAALESASAFESQKGNMIVKLAWRTVDLEHYWESIHGTSGAALRYTQEIVAGIGIDFGKLDTWDSLDTELRAREGTVFEVRVERNGDWVNTYVEGKPQGVQTTLPDVPIDSSDFVPAVASDDDEPIPF